MTAIARRYGTPTYAYDLVELRSRVTGLLAALPDGVTLLYSVKANPSLGLCEVLAAHGVGAEVSSVGELLLAERAGFAPERIMVSGPHKSAQVHDQVRPGMLVSVDSADELAALTGKPGPRRLVLRIRPDFEPAGEVPIGAQGRFGIPVDSLRAVRQRLGDRVNRVVGFHVYSGYQVLDGERAAANLAAAFDLGLRAADLLGITVEVMDVGGGFGVATDPAAPGLDLDPVRRELRRQRHRLPAARLIVELGRYLVATSGYYLTSVLGTQTRQGRPALVVDGGVHQRPDLCGLELSRRATPPLWLTETPGPLVPTDVLGCLCLPSDVLAEAARLPPLSAGDVLAFAHAGAYGLSAGPTAFLGHPAPPEIAFDGDHLIPLRHRAEPQAWLRDQLGVGRAGAGGAAVHGPARP